MGPNNKVIDLFVRFIHIRWYSLIVSEAPCVRTLFFARAQCAGMMLYVRSVSAYNRVPFYGIYVDWGLWSLTDRLLSTGILILAFIVTRSVGIVKVRTPPV